jgi:Zn-dependent protease with chaperone function
VPLPAAPGAAFGLVVLTALPWILVVSGIVLALLISPLAAVLALLGVVIAVANFRLGSPSHLLASLGGSERSAADEPRLFNVVEGLCVENGISMPKVRILDDPAANALLTAADDDGLLLICTSGLLGALDRIQLEGVMADTLAGAKRGDVKGAAMIARALGALGALSPAAASLAWRFTDPARQFRTDREACRMTCYPPGLLSALSALQGFTTTPAGLPTVFSRLSAPYWLIPLETGKPHALRAGELDLDLRISALAEL